ncbi:MAG: hypothetical protein KDC85_05360 [Saprospiraceae bacterium]|nr:hypothetical protein [Saprospiraceae bacterium]MCB9324973.1 hypothetical protein [Lewinellaceae bacterium]
MNNTFIPLNVVNNPQQPQLPEPQTNHKKWAFWLFVGYLVLNWAIVFVSGRIPEAVEDPVAYSSLLKYLLYISWGVFFIGLIFAIMSYRNREVHDYQYRVSMWGYIIGFILLAVSIIAYY